MKIRITYLERCSDGTWEERSLNQEAEYVVFPVGHLLKIKWIGMLANTNERCYDLGLVRELDVSKSGITRRQLECLRGHHEYDEGETGLSHNDPVTVYRCKHCPHSYWS